jgi:hypothetical protein
MGNYLLTFADTNLSRSSNRFKRQALEMNFYEKIFCYDETNLDIEFINKFGSKLIQGSRGFGYWSWKPQIILQVLQQLKDGEILQYTDVGCHLNYFGRERLLEYFNYTVISETGIVAFKASPPVYPLKYDGRKLFNQRDFMYVKGDLIDHFNFRDHSEFLNDYCIGATVIFIKKSIDSMNIIKEWLNVIYNDFTLIDNTPSKSKNLEGFIEHRHDQAIFSLLCKKYNVSTLSTYEYYYPRANSINPDWKHLRYFPIHAKRDKDFGLFKNCQVLVNRIINKIKKIYYGL